MHHTYTHTHTNTHAHRQEFPCLYFKDRLRSIYVCMYECMYVCTRALTHTRTHTYRSFRALTLRTVCAKTQSQVSRWLPRSRCVSKPNLNLNLKTLSQVSRWLPRLRCVSSKKQILMLKLLSLKPKRLKPKPQCLNPRS